MADYGSGECPECGTTVKLKQEGTLYKHDSPARLGGWMKATCEGSGQLAVSKPLGQTFPCVPGSMWRDANDDLWVLCADGRMRMLADDVGAQSPTGLEDNCGPLRTFGVGNE